MASLTLDQQLIADIAMLMVSATVGSGERTGQGRGGKAGAGQGRGGEGREALPSLAPRR